MVKKEIVIENIAAYLTRKSAPGENGLTSVSALLWLSKAEYTNKLNIN